MELQELIPFIKCDWKCSDPIVKTRGNDTLHNPIITIRTSETLNLQLEIVVSSRRVDASDGKLVVASWW